MSSGKFTRLLSGFDRKQRKHFRAFLTSPYPVNEPQLVALYDIILKQKSPEPLDKERAWKSLYAGTGKPYSDSHMRKLLSDLAKRAEAFLIAEARKSEAFDGIEYLMDTLSAGGHRKYFLQHYNAYCKAFDKKWPFQSREDFRKRLLVEKEYYSFSVAQGHDLDFGKLHDMIDLRYLVEKLYAICENRLIAISLDHAPDARLEQEVLEACRQEPIRDYALVQIYLNTYEFLTHHPDEAVEPFKKMLNILEAATGKMDIYELQSGFWLVYNLNVMAFNAAGPEQRPFYIEQFLRLIKDLAVFWQKHQTMPMDPWLMKNIVYLLCECDRTAEADAFIDENLSLVKPEHRANAGQYNRAVLHYYRKEYGDMRKLLQEVRLDDEFYALDSRSMLMRSYLETASMDALFSLIESFGKYLQRNKILAPVRKKSQRNRLKHVAAIARAMVEPNVEKKTKMLQKVREKVLQEKLLTSRAYLLEQIQRLESEIGA